MLVGGLIGFGIYKMSQRDADRIQEHTGIPPEELEDHELEHAMDELGIERQTISGEDQEVGSSAPVAPSSARSDVDELRALAELHEQGILTDEEFAAKKSQILGL